MLSIPLQPLLSRVVVGKWFWIGLGALVVALLLAFTPAREWGPYDRTYGQAGLLLNAMVERPLLWAAYAVSRIVLGFGSLWIASVVLLWIAFARPTSHDRVLFAAATTGTVFVFASILNLVAGLVIGANAVSMPIAMAVVGCVSIALAARGLRPVSRVLVQTLCVLALLDELSGYVLTGHVAGLAFVTGHPLPVMLGAALLGVAVLAFGIEFAEQCGAELYAFERRGSVAVHRPSIHLSSFNFIAFGTAGILLTILVGWGIVAGQIHVSPLASEAWVDTDIVGAFVAWMGVVALMWYGFAKTTTPSRPLFAAAVIAGTAFIAPNIAALFDIVSRQSGSSVVGFPPSSAVLATAGGLALLLVARGAGPRWRGILSWLCIAMIVLVVGVRFVVDGNPVYLASGVLLGASCFAIGVAIARHAGIDLFRTDDLTEEIA